MKYSFFAGVIAVFSMLLLLDANIQGGDKDKKEQKAITIKQVMKAHGKGGLLAKVKEGTATSEEKKKLLSLYEALGKTTPPRGDEASWKAKTAALVTAVKTNDVEALKKAADCKACHSEHKGKKKS
jgi:hypothetical protein